MTRALSVDRGGHRIHAEVEPGPGVPVGYRYTSENQAGDLAAVVGEVVTQADPADRVVLVAHDASAAAVSARRRAEG